MKILLIDDDAYEEAVLRRFLKALSDQPFQLTYVEKCSSAMRLLRTNTYDLVLLDDRLSRSMNSMLSLPLFAGMGSVSPIVIISNDISASHLKEVGKFGVEEVVSKSDLSKFLRKWIAAREL